MDTIRLLRTAFDKLPFLKEKISFEEIEKKIMEREEAKQKLYEMNREKK